MTRFARGSGANKKKPHDASSWEEMKADLAKAAKAKRPAAAAGGGASANDAKVITRLRNGQFVVRVGSQTKVLKSEEELRRWKRRRTDERRQRRQQQRQQARVCFNCRQPGHLVGDCPASSEAAGVCFRCGSADHALAACPQMPRRPAGGQQPELPYASCFVCGKAGHLSRSCPDNPRGLYPNGGGCLLCSSVEHFKRDCPLLQRRTAEAPVLALPTSAEAAGVDDEVPLVTETPAAAPKRKRKPKVKVVVV